MARTDNLTNFLTDVSTAIKTKKGDDTPIKASNFDTEIANLPSGGDNKYNVYYDKTKTATNFYQNITEIGQIDTSARTSFASFFSGFSNLQTIPLIDTSKGTSFSSMFSSCTVLTTISQINTSNGTNFSSMFNRNTGLLSIPQINTSKGTNFSSMFTYCENIVVIPELDLGKAINVSSMFTRCYDLVDFGGLKDLGKAYLTTSSANYTNYTLALSQSTKLTEQSIINVLNNLYDIASLGVQTQQCTIGSTNLAKLTSEAGQQALSNAQAKGWTVS